MAPKPQLVRLASVASRREGPATVVLDRERRLPGRGAYLCQDPATARPRRECLARATTRKAFARAFRRAVTVQVELVESMSQ